ncbi:MAG: hypothetical protein Q8865_09280 [Bacillota bacterium]|nr:hypothetical protein [Bacillota bacterium]
MENILNTIIDIENEAHAITQSAKNRQSSLQAEIQNNADAMKKSLADRADRRLGIIAEQEEKETVKRLAELSAYRDEELKKLDKFESENSDHLIEEITKRILK